MDQDLLHFRPVPQRSTGEKYSKGGHHGSYTFVEVFLPNPIFRLDRKEWAGSHPWDGPE